MRLIDRFNAMFGRGGGSGRTTSDELPASSSPVGELRRFAAERDRRAIVEVCRRMYDEDPRAEQAIRTLASDLTRGTFHLTVQEGPNIALAQEIADAVVDRLKLSDR